VKFRKKPVVIEAKRLLTSSADEVAKWCEGSRRIYNADNATIGLSIPTLEGEMAAAIGDWIIRGVGGEFYPCKPWIFEATYELVLDEEKR
jgi:hypothetical protein